jgi:hypothetical protein
MIMKMNKLFLSTICIFLWMGIYAQENGMYRVIGVTGRIVNQQSGKELQDNEQVLLQTTL